MSDKHGHARPMCGNETVTVRVVFGEPGAALGRNVRTCVFVQEQQIPPELEWDGEDAACAHAVAFNAAGEAVGTGRLMPDGRIGRMAVLAPWRRRGIGSQLLQALLDEQRTRQWPAAYLHAQLSAVEFYRRRGFHAEGPGFDEAGIAHQFMRRDPGDAVGP